MRGAEKMRVLSLFAGIGGFDLGLERTGGFETVAFCEIDPFCQRVLAKHWPNVPCYPDVKELTSERLAADGIAVDLICGGFPCQDISLAGNGAGLAGERSGLWYEYARLVGELRPRYVIVENVAALLGRGLDAVLGSMASLGYDAEWHCIPASAVGAPHRRDRLWIVAYPEHNGLPIGRGIIDAIAQVGQSAGISGDDGQGGAKQVEPLLADTAGKRRRKAREFRRDQPKERTSGSSETVPNANQVDAQRLICGRNGPIIRREQIERQARLSSGAGEYQDWSVEPAVGRVAHGIPDRVGQLRAYGNAVVPQIPELIGRAILASTAATDAMERNG